MMQLIDCDIKDKITMYIFKDFEAMEKFQKTRIDPAFIKGNLGIPWTPKMEFETMTEYNGFLVEV